jgi:hypothetical protein
MSLYKANIKRKYKGIRDKTTEKHEKTAQPVRYALGYALSGMR